MCFWTGLPAAARTASAGDWGSLGAPPLLLSPLCPAAEGPKPRPAPRGWGCPAERPARGVQGARRAPGAGAAQRLPHPILALQSQELLCWCGAGGTEGKGGWAGRGLPAGVGVMRSSAEAGSCPPAPCHTTTGGHRSQGGPWWVAASRGSLHGTGHRRGPSSSLATAVGLGELAPAAGSWLTWLLQGPGPRAATPSFGQPRFLAWEVPPKLQGPPAARTPPAMVSAVPCP